MSELAVFAFAIAASLAALAGGWMAFRFRDRLHLVLALAAGLLLGAAFSELLPESLELGEEAGIDTAALLLVVLTGFLTFYLLDALFGLHPHHDEHAPSTDALGTASVGGISLHSLLDGMGIGAAFQADPGLGVVVGIAVTGHRFSDGLNTVALLTRTKRRLSTLRAWGAVVVAAPTIGVALSYLVEVPDGTLAVALAFFSGMFIYVSASDLLPEAHHTHPTRWTIAFTFLGVLVLTLATRIGGG